MSKLIEDLIKESNQNQRFIPTENKWFICKPLQPDSFIEYFNRFKDAWRIIAGKSIAVHYKEDEYE